MWPCSGNVFDTYVGYARPRGDQFAEQNDAALFWMAVVIRSLCPVGRACRLVGAGWVFRCTRLQRQMLEL